VKLLDASIRNALLANASIVALVSQRVYKTEAPEGTTTPYIIFDQAATPLTFTLSGKAFTDYYMNVRVVYEGYGGEALADDLRVLIESTLTESAAITVAGKKVTTVRPSQEFSYSQRSGNQIFFHSGQQFKIQVNE